LVSNACRLRRKEVAARYGVSLRTLERRLKRGAFPRPSLIAGPVWSVADLEAAEQAGRLPSPA
jgi:predicted DNA-binding transcriptional regulator AlpA